MKALEILTKIKEGSFTPYTNDSLVKIDEAIKELEGMQSITLNPLECLIDSPIDSPMKLVKALSLTFGINFSIKTNYAKGICILSTDSTLDEDTILKVFEYIYYKKYGLWSVDTDRSFGSMSYMEYCNKKRNDDT